MELQADSVSNGVSIREYAAFPQQFCCHYQVGLRFVKGTGFVQLEHHCLHHIKSHVGHMMVSRKSIRSSIDEDEVPELMEERLAAAGRLHTAVALKLVAG